MYVFDYNGISNCYLLTKVELTTIPIYLSAMYTLDTTTPEGQAMLSFIYMFIMCVHTYYFTAFIYLLFYLFIIISF